MRIHSRAPDCNIVFFPFANENTSRVASRNAMNIKEVLSVRDDIIECSTSKPKGGIGTWSVMLSPRRNYKALLHPGCWCLIYMSDEQLSGKEKSEESSGLKMVGIVRTVRRKEVLDPATGARSVRYLVAGEDFQSVLNTPIYINANLTEIGGGKEDSITKAVLVLGPKFANILSPAAMVEALIDSLLGTPKFRGSSSPGVSRIPIAGRTGQPYKVPVALSSRVLGKPAEQNFFTGMMTLFIQKNVIGETQVKPDISGTVTTWSLLQAYTHRILNEIYTDLLPVSLDGQVRLVPSLIFRPIPFSSRGSRTKLKESSLIEFLDAGGRVVAKRSKGKAINATPFPQSRSKKKRSLDLDRNAHFYVARRIMEDEILGMDSGKV
jgi:hypothetical protein